MNDHLGCPVHDQYGQAGSPTHCCGKKKQTASVAEDRLPQAADNAIGAHEPSHQVSEEGQ